MNWEKAISEIQSPEFDANLNVVSSMDAFFRAANKEPAVREAYRCLRESGERREEVLDRIHDLAFLEVDPRYENPNDTALAVLLWLSYFAFPDDVDIAVDYVSGAPQCWYAAKLASQLSTPPQAKGDNFSADFGGRHSYWGPKKNLSTENINTRPIPSVSKLRVRITKEGGVPQSDTLDEVPAALGLSHFINSAPIIQYNAAIVDESILLMSQGSMPANSVTLRKSLLSGQQDDDQ